MLQVHITETDHEMCILLNCNLVALWCVLTI